MSDYDAARIEIMEKEIEKLTKQNEIMKEALSSYASLNSYISNFDSENINQKAKDALMKIEEIERGQE